MKATITISMCVVVLLFGVIQATCGQETPAQAAAVYSKIIDDFAAHCLFKTNLRYARGRHIRNAAAISCLKNNYWQNHKAALIDAMVAAGIGTKRYRVRHFLNGRFLAYVRSRNLDLKALHPLAALPEKPPEGFEAMTLAEFCRHFSLPKKEVAQQLDEQPAAPTQTQTIENIAAARDASPRDIYRFLRRTASLVADSGVPTS